jgi:hypothetical protein
VILIEGEGACWTQGKDALIVKTASNHYLTFPYNQISAVPEFRNKKLVVNPEFEAKVRELTPW